MIIRTTQLLKKCSDEKLMDLYIRGNNEAFSVIVSRYNIRLLRFMFKYIGNDEDSKDLVQDVYLRISRFKHRYDSNRKFSNWVFTIAINVIRTNLKKVNLIKTLKNFSECETIDIIDNCILQDEKMHQNQIANSLEKAIHLMPGLTAELLRMRILEEMSYLEIAEVTQLPIGTIKSRIGRARRQLRKMMRYYLV